MCIRDSLAGARARSTRRTVDYASARRPHDFDQVALGVQAGDAQRMHRGQSPACGQCGDFVRGKHALHRQQAPVRPRQVAAELEDQRQGGQRAGGDRIEGLVRAVRLDPRFGDIRICLLYTSRCV